LKNVSLISRIDAATVGLFFPIVLFIVNPIQVYSGSPGDFEFGLVQIAAVFLVAAVVVASIISAPFWFLSNRIRRVYFSFWGAAGLSAWIHSSFLVSKVGILNGDPLDLALTPARSGFYLLLFFAIFISSFLMCFYIPKKATSFMLVLVSILVLVAASGFFKEEKDWVDLFRAPLGTDAIFRYAEGPNNVVVVLMDGFQGDVFYEIAKEEQEISDAFSGFTYFKNAMGVAKTTYLSLPAIYSGQQYQIGESIREFIRGSAESSYLKGLDAHGIQVSVINPLMAPCPSENVLSSAQVLSGPKRALMKEVTLLADISLFRIVPKPVQSLVYRDQQWLLQRLAVDVTALSRCIADSKFLRWYAARIFQGGEAMNVKYIYLTGTHKPIDVNQDCEFEPQEFSRESYKYQVRCMLEAFSDYLGALRSLGIFDDTAILLIADHGVPCCLPNIDSGEDSAWSALAGAAHPVFVYKGFGTTGDLRVSEAPVQLIDVGATVCDLLGSPDSCKSSYGRPVSRIGEDETRDRYWLHYRWGEGGWKADTLPDIVEYRISGKVYDRSAWHLLSAGEK